MARYFTVEQAQERIPRLEEPLRQAMLLYEEHAEAEAALSAYAQHVAMAGGTFVDQRKFLLLRSRRDALARRLEEVVGSVREHGCQIKDLAAGLLDFPTRYRGVEVLLCWRLGESRIGHWHGLKEGFRGRKPIDEDFLENHGGDEPAR